MNWVWGAKYVSGLLDRVKVRIAKYGRRVVVWKANHWRRGRMLDWIKVVEGFQSNVQAV